MEETYKRAGERFGVDPRLLAAIGLSESRHGRARLPGVFAGVNFAGCCAGPAQLCVVRSCGRVWQHYRTTGTATAVAACTTARTPSPPPPATF
jgi:hypothetical protein